jgi:hypothetical protein
MACSRRNKMISKRESDTSQFLIAGKHTVQKKGQKILSVKIPEGVACLFEFVYSVNVFSNA